MSVLRIDEAASVQFPMVAYAVEIGWTPVPPKDATAKRGGEAGMLFRDDLRSRNAEFRDREAPSGSAAASASS